VEEACPTQVPVRLLQPTQWFSTGSSSEPRGFGESLSGVRRGSRHTRFTLVMSGTFFVDCQKIGSQHLAAFLHFSAALTPEASRS